LEKALAGGNHTIAIKGKNMAQVNKNRNLGFVPKKKNGRERQSSSGGSEGQ
jgi:hypothetical protein